MDISRLPEELLLQVLHYLPLKDRIRSGRVSQQFRRISIDTIQKMRSIDLDEDLAFFAPTPQSLRSILQRSASILERINASYKCDKWMLEMLTMFAYPKLKYLEVVINPQSPEDADFCRKCIVDLIRRGRNASKIVLRPGPPFEFPKDLVFENLKALEILGDPWKTGNVHDYDDVFKSLTGRVPNLKRLQIQTFDETARSSSYKMQEAIVDTLLATTPTLQELNLSLDSGTLSKLGCYFYRWSHIWRLQLLKSLELNILGDYRFSDVSLNGFIIQKIVNSFPDLEKFATNTYMGGGKWLIELKQLRHLRIYRFWMSHLIGLIEFCPNLSNLIIECATDAPKVEIFVEILKKISRSNLKQAKIRFSTNEPVAVWESMEVQATLKEIKDQGVDIQCEFGVFVETDFK